MMTISADGQWVHLPALTTVHSHAFQRAMRGLAQRPRSVSTQQGGLEREDFWSWRGAMYGVASSLTPESIERISRVAFAELRRAGVRTVGEFHYVHHQDNGVPYDDRTVMSDAVIRAAREEGLRITLLRAAYHRAGPGRAAEPGQARFCDANVDAVLADIERLRARYAGDPDVRIGVAPHSVRAVPPEWIAELGAYAAKHELPFHMHVAEQPREVAECIDETGRRPVELLADLEVLSPRFVAVHATHLTREEAALLGRARAWACICATTEADLGDGLPALSELRRAGVRLVTGIDSHIITDPIADVRALETLERLRSGTRVTFQPSDADGCETPAQALWRSGSIDGAIACGFEDAGSTVALSRNHPAFALVPDDQRLLDALVFGASGVAFEP